MPPVLIAAAVTAGGAYLSNKSASKAATQSAAASQQATDYATQESARQFDLSSATQKQQYEQSRADQMPWLNTGKGALNVIAQQYGIGSDGSYNPSLSGNFDAFKASPDYQFRLDEGARALTARNAALGIQDSGAAQRSSLSLGQNMASAEYGGWYNRLASLAGVGQTAANTTGAAGQSYANSVGTLGQNYANAVGNLATSNAANLASSYQAKSDAQQSLYGSLAGVGAGLLGKIPVKK